MKVKGSLWSCLRVKNCSFRTHLEVLECSVMCVQLSANRRNSSQRCAMDATTPNNVGTCSASWEGYSPQDFGDHV